MFSKLPKIFVALILLLLECDAQGSHSSMGRPGHAHQSHEHTHYVPSRDKDSSGRAQNVLKDKEFFQDKDHLAEELPDHLKDVDLTKMTPHEVEYHYFKIHDFDQNGFLDGLEMLSAFSHVVLENAPKYDYEDDEDLTDQMKRSVENSKKKIEEEAFKFCIDLIDRILDEDDINKDGYLSYSEYVHRRRS